MLIHRTVVEIFPFWPKGWTNTLTWPLLEQCLSVMKDLDRTEDVCFVHPTHAFVFFSSLILWISPSLQVLKLQDERTNIPAFLLKSDTLPGLRVLSDIRQTEAGGKTGHIGLNIMKDLPDAGSARSLHHRPAASGHNIHAFSLEKSKSWAPATIVQRQKMLTERCCAAATVIISCCFEKGETRSALKIKKISKQQTAQIRQKESTRKAMAIQARRRSSKAARLRSVKNSDASQLQRRAVRIIKKNELFKLDKEQGSVQRQRSLKAAYDDDGFFVKRQHSLVPREKAASINRLKCTMRAARDGDKEDFSGKIIAKQGGGSETGRLRTNAVENEERERLEHIRRAGLTHKADSNDVDREQTLTETPGEFFITLFLSHSETQTEPSLRKNIIPNTDTGWEKVNIPVKELDGPPAATKVLKENLIFQLDNPKCKFLKEIRFFLEIYSQERTEGINLEPAESAAEVTTAPATTAGEVTGGTRTSSSSSSSSSSMPPGNTSVNQVTKQEEGEPSEESVIPSPPSLKMMETETVTAGQTAETTTAIMAIKEMPSSTDVSHQSSTEETPTTKTSPESETEPGYDITNNNNYTQATTQTSFFGLRMREDVLKDTIRLHNGAESEGTDGPGNERNEDPKVNSFTSPSQTSRKQDADTLLEVSETAELLQTNPGLMKGIVEKCGKYTLMPSWERWFYTKDRVWWCSEVTRESWELLSSLLNNHLCCLKSVVARAESGWQTRSCFKV